VRAFPRDLCVYPGERNKTESVNPYMAEMIVLARWLREAPACRPAHSADKRNPHEPESALPPCGGADILVAPSPAMHYAALFGWSHHAHGWSVMRSLTRRVSDEWWRRVHVAYSKAAAVNGDMGLPPPIVVSVWPFSSHDGCTIRLLRALWAMPKAFTSRVVLATSTPSLKILLRDFHFKPPKQQWLESTEEELRRRERMPAQSERFFGGPLIAALPFTTGITGPASWGALPEDARTRPLTIDFAAPRKSAHRHDEWVHSHIAETMKLAGGVCNDRGTRCALCRAGVYRDECKYFVHAPEEPVSTHARAVFCVIAPGEALVTEALYGAAAADCIPVIFQGGSYQYPQGPTWLPFQAARQLPPGLDPATAEARAITKAPALPRSCNTPDPQLDYDRFTVRLDAQEAVGSRKWIEHLSLLALDKEALARMRKALREEAMPLFTYKPRDCGSPSCDAVNGFRALVHRVWHANQALVRTAWSTSLKLPHLSADDLRRRRRARSERASRQQRL